jgi:hypothetical protein
MTLDELVETWRTEAEILRKHGLTDHADALLVQADQVAAARETEANALVTMEEAARIAGKHADTIRRWVRAKTLHNHAPEGEPPLVRRGDIPMRPTPIRPFISRAG